MSTWRSLDHPLILASRSPRRRQILSFMGFDFETVAPSLENEEEYLDIHHLPASLCRLARAKALSVARHHPASCVFSGDTVVVADERIIGKPRSEEDARSMLHTLSARMHKVFSGVALVCREIDFSAGASACTEVYFRALTEDEIDEYLACGEYADKAGAYGIQGKAMTFVDRIKGCYCNVVGLPISATIGVFTAYHNRKGAKNDKPLGTDTC